MNINNQIGIYLNVNLFHMKDGLKFNTENARLYVFKDQIRMLIAIVWCLVTGTLFTGVSVYFSHINRYRIDYIQFNLCSAIFLFIICIFTIKWQSLLQTNHVPDRLPLLILVMTIAGIAITSGMLMIIAAMKSGYSDVVWSICQSSMIIPFITSILLNGESVKLYNIIGIISIIFGIIILGTKQKINHNQGKKGWFVLTLIAFFVVGGGQYCFSIPSFWPGWQDTYSLRIPIQATGGLLLLTCLTRPAQLFKISRKLWLHGFAFAILTFAGRYTLYCAIDALTKLEMGSIAYPVCLGLSILGFTIYYVASQKKVNKKSITAVIFLIGGLLLIGYKQ